MAKQTWKPGNMLYPLPAVMLSCSDGNKTDNIITVAWVGTVCSDPAMVSVSIRKERYSHHIIKESGEFVINLTTKETAYATDKCGVISGRDHDKWAECSLTKEQASKLKTPCIKECPVNIECKVKEVIELGSHDMFIAEVVAVDIDDKYMDETGKFDLIKANPIVYNHGEYYGVEDKPIGKFGFSVKKK